VTLWIVLHRAGRLDAVSFRVPADDLQPLQPRGALAKPHVLFDGLGGRGPLVRADKPQRRTGAIHPQGGRAVGCDGRVADLVEVDDDRPRNAKDALREPDAARPRVDELLERIGLVRRAIADKLRAFHLRRAQCGMRDDNGDQEKNAFCHGAGPFAIRSCSCEVPHRRSISGQAR
jgi:hypothetical protein